jgi:uncharacterized protein YrrD
LAQYQKTNPMLYNVIDLYGTNLSASDGILGTIDDFYFDDATWAIRYLVADTGGWLTGRQVLLAPISFGSYHPEKELLIIDLKRQQIADSPAIESHKPVSRQWEDEYYRHYGWPTYWAGDTMTALGASPIALPPSPAQMETSERLALRHDKHLRSSREIIGYDIEAIDGAIGTVSGFLVEEMDWRIYDLVVETGHWYAGKEIWISTNQIDRISYPDTKVFVNLTRAEIEQTSANKLAKQSAAHS